MGTRPAGQITHLVPMGRPYSTGRASPPLVQLLAAQFTFQSRPTRTQTALGTMVHWNSMGQGGVDVLHVVVPESCNAACVSMVQRATHGLSESGLDMEWATTLLRLPRDPEFLEPGLEALANHVIGIRNAEAARRHAPPGSASRDDGPAARRSSDRLPPLPRRGPRPRFDGPTRKVRGDHHRACDADRPRFGPPVPRRIPSAPPRPPTRSPTPRSTS